CCRWRRRDSAVKVEAAGETRARATRRGGDTPRPTEAKGRAKHERESEQRSVVGAAHPSRLGAGDRGARAIDRAGRRDAAPPPPTALPPMASATSSPKRPRFRSAAPRAAASATTPN